MGLSASLDQAVRVVCPIQGVSVGDENDKNTWWIRFKPEATAQQRAEAQSVLDSFVYVPSDPADLDNLEKAVKVSMLLSRQYANQIKAGSYAGSGPGGTKTVAELKADIKQIWDVLP